MIKRSRRSIPSDHVSEVSLTFCSVLLHYFFVLLFLLVALFLELIFFEVSTVERFT